MLQRLLPVAVTLVIGTSVRPQTSFFLIGWLLDLVQETKWSAACVEPLLLLANV